MKRHLRILTALTGLFLFCAETSAIPPALPPAPEAAAPPSIPSGEALEKALQSLSWAQFTFVVQAIPKLKAKVDAYGPFGWRYVQSRYTTYDWKKSIDKFSPEERKQLAELIQQAQATGTLGPH